MPLRGDVDVDGDVVKVDVGVDLRARLREVICFIKRYFPRELLFF